VQVGDQGVEAFWGSGLPLLFIAGPMIFRNAVSGRWPRT